jgi:hypothetical protein
MAHVKVFILYPTILVLSKIASKSYKKKIDIIDIEKFYFTKIQIAFTDFQDSLK